MQSVGFPRNVVQHDLIKTSSSDMEDCRSRIKAYNELHTVNNVDGRFCNPSVRPLLACQGDELGNVCWHCCLGDYPPSDFAILITCSYSLKRSGQAEIGETTRRLYLSAP